jgi:glycosyltransferase involved in cell wall biosynthesis
MPAKLLSIVMATHNRPEQMERAVKSLLSQRVPELEVVIVDDASTDQTPQLTDRLAADGRVQVVRNIEPLGPSGARNAGIAVARGDLLGFCDDDDAWLPGAATILLNTLEANRDLGVVTSWHRVVHDRTGKQVDYRGPTSFTGDDLLWLNFVALPFGIIRRSSFDEDLMFDPSLRGCEDWDLWLRCAQLRPIEAVPHVLYSYHQHGGDRVTKDGAGSRRIRPSFLEKHAASMTPACRIYHQAVIAADELGRSAMLKEIVSAGSTMPAAAGFAASVLATSFATSTIGIRRHDPGLPARCIHRLISNRSDNGVAARLDP